MTPSELAYIQRAAQQLDQMDDNDRIKVQKTMSQILARSAHELEQKKIDKMVDNLVV